MEILALATADPVESEITPESVAPVTCASAGVTAKLLNKENTINALANAILSGFAKFNFSSYTIKIFYKGTETWATTFFDRIPIVADEVGEC
jgi:hypothetical protein